MPEKPDPKGLAGLPTRTLATLSGIEVAILGASEASPYVLGEPSHAAGAPAAIRRASQLFAAQLNQFDFDLGRVLAPKDAAPRIADLGDIPTNAWDPEGNRARITEAVRRVLAAGARPLVLGGDDSVPIPVFAAFAGRGPITIVQIDAHVDWGDDIRKNPLGYGSTMRRASEMPHITAMVQVGIRGLGSGTPDQMDDARAWGSRIVSARDLRRNGPAPVLGMIPEATPVLLSIDCDGLDPSVLPAVNMPTPGGLDMLELTELLAGIALRAPVVGCNLVELVPAKDPTGLSATVAARIALTALGSMLPP